MRVDVEGQVVGHRRMFLRVSLAGVAVLGLLGSGWNDPHSKRAEHSSFDTVSKHAVSSNSAGAGASGLVFDSESGCCVEGAGRCAGSCTQF